MKRILILALGIVVLAVQAAQAERGRVYAAGSLGYGVVADFLDVRSEIGIDSGWGLIAALGYDTNKFRLEGEVSYRKYDLDELHFDSTGDIAVDGTFTALSYMANAFYDFNKRGTPWRPYAGIGFGVTQVEIDLTGFGTTNSTELAYQLMGGISLRSRSNWFMRAGYRFFGYTSNDGHNIHELSLGAGYMF